MEDSHVEGILSSYPDDPAARLSEDLSFFDSEEITVERGPVTQCGICLTDCCQLRCTYCSNSSDNTGDTLNVSQVAYFIREMAELRLATDSDERFRITFSGGGEPTLNWDLFQSSVLSAKEITEELGLKTSLYLTTNGMVDDTKIDFIISNFDNVMVSYDGSPLLNARHRPRADGKDVSSTVERTIDGLSAKMDSVSIRSTFWPSESGMFMGISDYLAERFPDVKWSMNMVMPAGRGLVLGSFEEMDAKKIVDDYLRVFVKRKDELGVLTDFSIFGRTAIPLMCGAVLPLCSGLWLEPNGNIVNCAEECDKTVLGQVIDSGVQYKERCSDSLLKICCEKLEECRPCVAYRFCKGGCPARHQLYSEMGIPNLECLLIKEYWYRVIEAMVKGRPYFGMTAIPSERYGDDVLDIHEESEY